MRVHYEPGALPGKPGHRKEGKTPFTSFLSIPYEAELKASFRTYWSLSKRSLSKQGKLRNSGKTEELQILRNMAVTDRHNMFEGKIAGSIQ